MIAPNKSVLVDMVYAGCHGRYNRDEKLDIEILELPYNPSSVSIFFSHYFTPTSQSII